jgi:hypothetical protein
MSHATKMKYVQTKKTYVSPVAALNVSPEVLQENFDKPCDIWGLGVIFSIIILGFNPYNDNLGTRVTLEKIIFKRSLDIKKIFDNVKSYIDSIESNWNGFNLDDLDNNLKESRDSLGDNLAKVIELISEHMLNSKPCDDDKNNRRWTARELLETSVYTPTPVYLKIDPLNNNNTKKDKI